MTFPSIPVLIACRRQADCQTAGAGRGQAWAAAAVPITKTKLFSLRVPKPAGNYPKDDYPVQRKRPELTTADQPRHDGPPHRRRHRGIPASE